VSALREGTAVRSTPQMRYSSLRISKRNSFLRGVRVTLWRQLWGIGRKLAVKVLQLFLDFLVAGGDQGLVVTIRFQGLT